MDYLLILHLLLLRDMHRKWMGLQKHHLIQLLIFHICQQEVLFNPIRTRSYQHQWWIQLLLHNQLNHLQRHLQYFLKEKRLNFPMIKPFMRRRGIISINSEEWCQKMWNWMKQIKIDNPNWENRLLIMIYIKEEEFRQRLYLI